MMPALRRAHRVRWSECDMHGHVNHTAYLEWFEDLRVLHWESLGQSFRPRSVGPVVGQLSVRYLAPLAFGEEVELCLSVPSLRRTSFVHEYVVLKDGQRVFECSAVIVCVDNAAGGRVPIPPEARALMLERDGAQAEG
ncbi:acyl-CoA thioesterase [Rhodovarius lipocyclicus]|jgi:YbgC/YbaW family acyl-CoA thioester hydrolase|uniref:acyl-CoA thioesterase n=1 Tax=Rhodovarius lipocyclicus TaxID=268410 RepID=UPI0013577D47|nr:acyl-CoA thioesterase [Rhodovarius lipocyclicus]